MLGFTKFPSYTCVIEVDNVPSEATIDISIWPGIVGIECDARWLLRKWDMNRREAGAISDIIVILHNRLEAFAG